MRKHFFVFATLALGFLLSAAELPLSKFMERARNPNSGSTFAALSGQIQHRRAGGKVTCPAGPFLQSFPKCQPSSTLLPIMRSTPP